MRTILVVLLLAFTVIARAQGSEPDIPKYLAMIKNGEGERVKGELPTLLTKYPNNPGVMYIQGLLTSEGADAVRIYQSIVDNFPKCEWADAALYKVYQFYYALGLYRTAELKMNQLKAEYPQSKYLTAAAEQTRLPEEATDTTGRVAKGATDSSKTIRLQVQFSLQVGAYAAQANAEKQKTFFEGLGYPAEIISKLKDNRSLFLVLVGAYPTYDDAKAHGNEIKQKHNIDSIVISR